MRSEFRALRDEMKLFRGEVQSEFRAVRSEMQSEFRAVRTEMHGEFRAVRDEMKVMRSDISKEISGSAKETQARFYTSVVMLIVGLAAISTALDFFID